MLRELRNVIGAEPELEVVKLSPAQPESDLSRFSVLAGIIRELDGDGVPIPYLVSGGTDGRHFAQLGLRTYGFTPVRMPPGFDGWSTIHDADERIPVDALEFGTEAIHRAVLRM
jgi:acetylornithine deacetylase/succinyl-diaminopimelate desuccinylase-like protein